MVFGCLFFIPLLVIPTCLHRWNRQYWHWFRVDRTITHCRFLGHLYLASSPFTLLRKNFLHASQTIAPQCQPLDASPQTLHASNLSFVSINIEKFSSYISTNEILALLFNENKNFSDLNLSVSFYRLLFGWNWHIYIFVDLLAIIINRDTYHHRYF